MSKQLKISDEVYHRLKGHADSNYRSLGGQVEFLLDQFEGIKIMTPRTMGEMIRVDRPVDKRVPVETEDSVKNPRDIPLKNKSEATPQVCKHGVDPYFCKHAKPGQRCK